MTTVPRALFVYGTLRPGGRYWPNLAEYVVQYDPAMVEEFELWHLDDEGYPAMIPGEGKVLGDLLYLRRGHEKTALAIADEIEEFDGSAGSLYVRREVEAIRLNDARRATVPAETYVFNRDRHPYLRAHATPIPTGDWREFIAGDDGEED